ncbi:hypothetical protein FIV00_03455 [Labrenzia sp. THAF82]|uniref:hypothetical protein n=1 Tax=Labrenzia sp. THAF82 TaxID=2587861 RepID=UPI0012AA088D|nr:hypothetical protein [Labrenzia sp. THAF82]QFT29525.1 hypothetical protein FIV00_03455 [Labrenzia sp. THAF82]
MSSLALSPTDMQDMPKHANILAADPFAYKTAHRRLACPIALSGPDRLTWAM